MPSDRSITILRRLQERCKRMVPTNLLVLMCRSPKSRLAEELKNIVCDFQWASVLRPHVTAGTGGCAAFRVDGRRSGH